MPGNHTPSLNPFDVARQALASLELYQTYFASSEGFQKHKEEVANIVDQRASNPETAHTSGGQLLKGLAAAIRQM